MYRNPFFDAYAGAMLALGGPMAFLLPQRIALAMMMPEPLAVPTGSPHQAERPEPRRAAGL